MKERGAGVGWPVVEWSGIGVWGEGGECVRKEGEGVKRDGWMDGRTERRWSFLGGVDGLLNAVFIRRGRRENSVCGRRMGERDYLLAMLALEGEVKGVEREMLGFIFWRVKFLGRGDCVYDTTV